MSRFAALLHDHPWAHVDWLVERGNMLLAWRLARMPTPGAVIEATALPPHRRHYLNYEGPVGGGRGTVARWDVGTCRGTFADSRVESICDGVRVRGRIVLDRIDGERWLWRWLDGPGQ